MRRRSPPDRGIAHDRRGRPRSVALLRTTLGATALVTTAVLASAACSEQARSAGEASGAGGGRDAATSPTTAAPSPTTAATSPTTAAPSTEPSTPDSVVVTDAAGRRLALPRPARRIVSLVPSATKTLHALGVDGRLVGRTDYDTQPWALRLPSVGGGLDPSLEAIVALHPDLVVRFGGEQDTRTPRRLDELGIPLLTVRPDRVRDILETARLLGAVTGTEREAEALASSIERGLERVRASVEGGPRLSAAYVLGGSPPWVAGPGTYIDEVLDVAGADNAFADLDALYSAVSPEVLRTRDIDVVLVPGTDQYDESLTPGARVVVVGDALDMPGPDVVDAARLVADLLHGRAAR